MSTAGNHHDLGAAPEVTVRIKTHPSLCNAWGQCHRWAPDVYPLDEDGIIDVHRAEVPDELALHAWYGAQACPQRAITVIGPDEEYWAERRRVDGERRAAANARRGAEAAAEAAAAEAVAAVAVATDHPEHG